MVLISPLTTLTKVSSDISNTTSGASTFPSVIVPGGGGGVKVRVRSFAGGGCKGEGAVLGGQHSARGQTFPGLCQGTIVE